MLSHREACYELRRSAALLAQGKIDRQTWFESVSRILAAREASGGQATGGQ